MVNENSPLNGSNNRTQYDGNENVSDIIDDFNVRTNSCNKTANNVNHRGSIGKIGSFALIFNNITGPAMMGLPHVFHDAGLLPTIACILFVAVSSSLCSTLMADVIAQIPGNENFKNHIDFSGSFLSLGRTYLSHIAEVLFIISCTVQACAALVESAQSVDGILSSFILGRTYALQLLPSIQLISWENTFCQMESETSPESSLEDCTPFNNDGTLIFTSGFLIVTILFLPLGRGNLEETILIQMISFAFCLLLTLQFSTEFIQRGVNYDIPWIGDDFSQLAGVILFNYAFSVTIPSWLHEKKETVSINQTIWSATMLSAFIYIAFGALGAMSFITVSADLLILLSSGKVHVATRCCAVAFGLVIIGCGVPVICVIIKNSLVSNKICSMEYALFWGSVFPYIISWAMYQGKILLNVLNWTGLIINGLVAFILPLVLVLESIKKSSEIMKVERSDSLSTQSTAPLPAFLYLYKRSIVIALIATFSSMILITIIIDIVDGITPDEDYYPEP